MCKEICRKKLKKIGERNFEGTFKGLKSPYRGKTLFSEIDIWLPINTGLVVEPRFF